ncbi:hypothetical protein BDF19DRAFT_441856 [Syncephalis fuscata]|nr:hypothetical protein BDF19DRAFT_441856 [Syncephalis fuscata]
MSSTAVVNFRALSTRGIYRRLLREVDQQFTTVNHNNLWRNEIRDRFRQYSMEQDTTRLNSVRVDAENVLAFLHSRRRYQELMLAYYPPEMSQSDRITASAKRVGLSLPEQEASIASTA